MAWQERWTRRVLIATTIGAIPAAFGIQEVRRRRQEKATQDQWVKQMLERGEKEIHWWPNPSLRVETNNTRFIQDQPFSPGRAFREPDPIAFPFIIRIDKEAVRVLREGISHVISSDKSLEVHATKPEIVQSSQADESGRKLTISLPFDYIVAKHVFPNFRARNLFNEAVAKDFTSAIAYNLFYWMLYEVHYASNVASILEDSPERELLFWMAELSALKFATDKSQQFRSPFVIEPIPLFQYENYYQRVIDRLATTQ